MICFKTQSYLAITISGLFMSLFTNSMITSHARAYGQWPAMKWRLHRWPRELTATDAGRTLYYIIIYSL
jgi:hypothetical protein